jgi:hypothetical protein
LKSTDADLVLEINADTRKGNAMDKFYSSLLSARIRLTNGDGKLLHEIRLNDIKGVQLSYEKASDESYSKAAGEIRKRYYRDLFRAVFGSTDIYGE